jgi:hypothetical protein
MRRNRSRPEQPPAKTPRLPHATRSARRTFSRRLTLTTNVLWRTVSCCSSNLNSGGNQQQLAPNVQRCPCAHGRYGEADRILRRVKNYFAQGFGRAIAKRRAGEILFLLRGQAGGATGAAAVPQAQGMESRRHVTRSWYLERYKRPIRKRR